MNSNQKICCSVTSCKYNGNESDCTLKQIKVTPMKNVDTKKADESMCSSYCYNK